MVSKTEKMFPSTVVFCWWVTLCIVGFGNLVIMAHYWRRLDHPMPSQYLVSALCFVYVAVCAFRSFLPRRDDLSICFFKGTLSTPLIGRAAATCAEVAFAILIAIVYASVVKTVGATTRSQTAIWLIIPIICIAQCFCWYGIEVSIGGHIVEETLWTLCAVILAAVIVSTRNEGGDDRQDHRRLLRKTLLVLLIYILFMVTIDIPMYVNSWQEHMDKKLPESSSCARVSRSWDDWKEAIPWMSGYFILGSWSAMYLVSWYNQRYA